MDKSGPPFTILDVRTLTGGRVRVLVRKRGGRLVRLCVAGWATDPANMVSMIEQVIASWPEIPDPRLVED